MPEFIFDSCVLSNFALSDGMPVLKRLYAGRAYITNFVTGEIARGIHGGHEKLAAISRATKDGWLEETTFKTQKEKAFFDKLSVSLGSGEASCIAIARSRGYHFASDDRAARTEAALLHVTITGTIGVLLRGVKKNVIDISEGDRLLKRMIKTGFFSPVNSLRLIK
jgi:predicted nucleic acid-binding protein